MRSRFPLLLLLLAGLLGACATFTVVGGLGSPTPTPTITPTPSVTPTTPAPTPTPGIYLRPGQHAIGSGVNTASASFPLMTTSGDVIVAALALPQGITSPGLTDDAGDNFVQADMAATPGGNQLWIYYAKNVLPGTLKVSANFVGGAAGTLAIAELGGASLITPFEAAAHKNGTGITASSGNLFLNAAGDLLVSAALSDGMPGSTTAGGTYILLDKMDGLADEYRIDPSAGNASASFDYNVSEGWVCSMAAFRP